MALLTEKLRAQLFKDMNVTKRLMHPHFVNILRELELSPTQSYILMIISEQQPLSLKTLASHMMMTPGAITQLVRPLEERELLARIQDNKDRRTVYVTVTTKGDKMVKTITTFRDKIMTEILSALTSEEIQQLAIIQHKMADHLEKNLQKFTVKKEK